MPRTPGELILSGNHMCNYSERDGSSPRAVSWILGTVWEVLALSLAGWIAVKHFRELRQFSTGFYHQRPFRSVTRNSPALLCKVGS
jgi:hypothetical protein